jgi:hypothetical protein
MKITVRILSFALLSLSAAFAQIPNDRAALTEVPATSVLPIASGSPRSKPEFDSEDEFSKAADPALDDAVESSSPPPSSIPAKEPGNLHIFWVPGYIWFSSVSGNVGAAGFTVPIDASFSDIFNNLNIGYAGGVDVRYRRLGLITDLTYIKLTTQEQSTPYGLLYSSVRTRSKTFFIEPEFYARVFDNRLFSADVLAGVRVWRLDNALDFAAARLPALTVDNTSVWADPLLGARLRANLSKGLFLVLKGEAGVGSNRTWQLTAGGGKEFKEKYSVLLGYRHLHAYNNDGRFLFDTSMNGLLLGFGIRFK